MALEQPALMSDAELRRYDARRARKKLFWKVGAFLAVLVVLGLIWRLFPVWICSDARNMIAKSSVHKLEMKTWCGCFNGMTREEVMQQFGWAPPARYGTEDIIYDTGQSGGLFPIGSELLVFRFRDDIVIETAIISDSD
ncbi:MAG TPA: hypothetical protein VG797_02210 [Phycisphaerales bacterium]|nr:hypothetical protein [Phycisphaerales bacterium]